MMCNTAQAYCKALPTVLCHISQAYQMFRHTMNTYTSYEHKFMGHKQKKEMNWSTATQNHHPVKSK
jgi:hypothetical protein